MKRTATMISICLLMLVLLLPAQAAAGSCRHSCGDGLCDYRAAVPGQPCQHEHDGCGFEDATEGDPCNCGAPENMHSDDCASVLNPPVPESPCEHAHDSSCGYAAAIAGVSCNHSHSAACGYSEHSHSWSGWRKDDKYHWQRCVDQGCDEIRLKTKHADRNATGKCDDCGYDLHTHSYSAVDYNGDNHWGVCSCGDKKDEAAHEWTYTYDDDQMHTMACTVCEYEAGGSHFGIINTMVDDDYHWWNLPCCGNEKNKGSHTYDNAYATQCNATFGLMRCTYDRSQSCTHSWGNYSNKDDVHEKTCSKCGLIVREDHTANTYKWIDGKEIAAAHTEVCVCGKSWDVAHTWTQASTHSSICTECNYYLDNHTYTAFKPSEANPETYHVLHCSVCGEMSDPVQVAGHNYEVKNDAAGHWNLCTDCGYTTAKTAHQMTVSQWEGTSLVHINTCSVCQHEVTENCDFKQGTYAGNEDGHWAVCFACGRTHSGIPLQAHVDENADGTCDVCKEKYTPPHTHSYKDKYDSTGHYTECDCGEKTEVQAHSYTGMFDSTCDCGYDRGLFKVGTVDTDYVDVGFIPGDGVTLPDDAELVVEDHYPSLAPIAGVLGIDLDDYLHTLDYRAASDYLRALGDDSLGTFTIPADYNHAAIDLAPGKTYKVSVIGANDISVKGYDEALLNSITEDTPEIAAAKAELERREADMGAKLMALTLMDINDPNYADAKTALIEAQNAYASARASLADLTNLQGATVSQTFKIPDAQVGANTVQYVAVHDTNPYAADLAEAERRMKALPNDETRKRHYETVKALYDGWEEENDSGAEFGTVTISLDGLTLTATHTAVKGFSPFIVYAFVEADEPEYKTFVTQK